MKIFQMAKKMLGDGDKVIVTYISDWSEEVETFGDTLENLGLHKFRSGINIEFTGRALDTYFEVYYDNQVVARINYDNCIHITYSLKSDKINVYAPSSACLFVIKF